MLLDGARIVITGGTGSFSHKFIETVLRDYKPKKVVVFSRDEHKQSDMRKLFPATGKSPMRYIPGDVRDVNALMDVFRDVDIVVHAAAMKEVDACEYAAWEATLTNVWGAHNVIKAALERGVKRVLALSSDKGSAPLNCYGATKLLAEKLFIQGNALVGDRSPTRFSCVRYGNVLGSRSSVVPLWRAQRVTGEVTITDPRMTRFWVTLDGAVRFVIESLEMMQGGEVFIPRLASMRPVDLANLIAPGCKHRVTGVRPGEKLHESLVSEEEGRQVVDLGDRYAVLPAYRFWAFGTYPDAKRMPDDWCYTSKNNDRWLSPHELLAMLGEPVAQAA